jgi:hypothetical protein
MDRILDAEQSIRTASPQRETNIESCACATNRASRHFITERTTLISSNGEARIHRRRRDRTHLQIVLVQG